MKAILENEKECDNVEEVVKHIEGNYPEIMQQYRIKIHGRDLVITEPVYMNIKTPLILSPRENNVEILNDSISLTLFSYTNRFHLCVH